MKTEERIQTIIVQLEKKFNRNLNVDHESLLSEYTNPENNLSLPIKILLIIGGILSSISFLSFIGLMGLFQSGIGMIFMGITLIISAILLHKTIRKIILETIFITSYILGFTLIGFGCNELNLDRHATFMVLIVLGIIFLCLIEGYFFVFFTIQIINTSILGLILQDPGHEVIYIYLPCLMATLLYLIQNESMLMAKNERFLNLFLPLRTSLLFACISVYFLLCNKWFIHPNPIFSWIPTLLQIAGIIYLLTQLFPILGINQTKQKMGISFIPVLLLLPTLFFPSISGAILVMLLSFKTRYKTGLILGILSLNYFIFQFYYDLAFTLLIKSIFLFVTGLLFLLIYMLTYKKLIPNEKI